MANLMQKTKFINIVVRKLDLDISERDSKILKWCKDNCTYYSYIYHKHDISTIGEVESPHLHLVCTLNKSQRISTTLNSFVDSVNITTLGVMIDKVNSYEGSMQYLVHKNDPNKTQHEFNEVIHNYNEKDFLMIMTTDVISLTPQRLYDIVLNARSNFEIIQALGINKYSQLRKVIQDIKSDIAFGKQKQYFNDIKESAI